MKLQQFLAHYDLKRNPFAEEDAQTDPVFKDYCIASTYHPTWDKVYGDPTEPATSIVFGEKGSGKTAMRLQIVRHLQKFNEDHPGQRLFLIEYDDFNPFLDRFKQHVSRRKRKPEKLLAQWHLWDHMDAILSLGVTGLVNQTLGVQTSSRVAANEFEPKELYRLDRHQARDLLQLAAYYDQSTAETTRGRWHRLRKKLRFNTLLSKWNFALGWIALIAAVGLIVTLLIKMGFPVLNHWYVKLIAALAAASWIPWLIKQLRSCWLAWHVIRNQRVCRHELMPLRHILMQFTGNELAGQPAPSKQSTDDRYDSLLKLQAILETLGFGGIIVLVDRVDEPHLINGSAPLMKALLWPMLDNKFLKHPGLGLKMMLPAELSPYIEKEDREFYQRARLDKQNMVPTFEWTGEALLDVANDRLKACADNGSAATLRDFFDDTITDQRMLEAVRSLRVPRHLFRFLYRLFVAHCNAHTGDRPEWQIPTALFEAQLALYNRELGSYDGSGPA